MGRGPRADCRGSAIVQPNIGDFSREKKSRIIEFSLRIGPIGYGPIIEIANNQTIFYIYYIFLKVSWRGGGSLPWKSYEQLDYANQCKSHCHIGLHINTCT